MEKENKERLLSEEEGAGGAAAESSEQDPGLKEPLSGDSAGDPGPPGEKEWLCQKEELIALVQRKQADLDNFRRISRNREEEIRNYGLFEFLKGLLPVLDNMERALATAYEDGDVPEAHIKGLEMIRKQMLQLLEQEGVVPIEALGETFDPHIHEAVMQSPGGEGAPGSVVEEIQKGYLYRERVLRPARVAVK